jgi:hypothetical protein
MDVEAILPFVVVLAAVLVFGSISYAMTMTAAKLIVFSPSQMTVHLSER